MGKLPNNLADPLDTLFYNISDCFVDTFYNVGFTPNMITTIGNIFAFLSIKKLYYNDLWGSFLFGIIRQIFDCMDGQMARKYKMFSKFGDRYDHFSDLVYSFSILYVAYTKIVDKQTFILLILLLVSLYGIYWSCEGDYKNNDSEFYILKNLCKNKHKELLPVFRFCGPQMTFLFLYMIMYYLN
jgi:phosphatidylglycerophosphate synthase